MKRVYEIEHSDDLGEFWMNVWNLDNCLHTYQHCFPGACKVTDVTDPNNPIEAHDRQDLPASPPKES